MSLLKRFKAWRAARRQQRYAEQEHGQKIADAMADIDREMREDARKYREGRDDDKGKRP